MRPDRFTPPGPGDRFRGFEVLSQSDRWDQVTAGVVLARVGRPPEVRFFTPAEQAIGTALVDRLLAQDGPERHVPVLALVDARLAEQQTDGWHYQDMPEDGQAWRDSLAGLDADASAAHGHGFAHCSPSQQRVVIQAVQDAKVWHAMPAKQVWSLWTRYACTAFYAHPWAWNEIGFPGPAYPRGYKNSGIDAREPFEVTDVEPANDPTRGRT